MTVHGVSMSVSDARVSWDAELEDDLVSIKRFLFLEVGAGINLYTWPLEQTFERPAITVRAIPGTSRESDFSLRRSVRSAQYDVQHQILITCFHDDRVQTVGLAMRCFRALREGGDANGGAALSIPLYSTALRTVVARSLRVLRPSLTMGVEATDDEGKWSAPVSATVLSPRLRAVSPEPTIERIVLNP